MICIAIFLLILVAIFWELGVFRNVEYAVQDRLYQKSKVINHNIYVIGIDEETLDNYGKFSSFSREKIADLVELLNSGDSKPAVIGLDISFFGEEDEFKDHHLAEVVGEADNVVLVSAVTMGNVPGKGQTVYLYEEPYDELKNNCNKIGFSNLGFDSDGAVRHGLRSIEINENQKIISFAEMVYKTYLLNTNQEVKDSELDNIFYIAYSGKLHSYFGSVGAGSSLYRVLNGLYPKEAFNNAIVLVGAYASGMQDNYYTSIETGDQMYGVEIHANIINQMIDGVSKYELKNPFILVPSILLTLLSCCYFYFLNDKKAIFLTVITIPFYIIFCDFSYNYFDIVLPVFVPILLEIVIVIATIIYLFVKADLEKKKIIASYARYISPEVAKEVVDKGDLALELKGKRKKDCSYLC